MAKLNLTNEVNWTVLYVNGTVTDWELVTLSSWVAVATSADTDLILWVSKWNDGTYTTVIKIEADCEYVIPEDNITVDSTFTTSVNAKKMTNVYFTWTTFTHSATNNTLVWYCNKKVAGWYAIRFLASVLTFGS